MKKILSLVIGIGAFIHGAAQITVNGAIPSSIPAGSSVDADITINKGNVGNFAKYQMDVPAGYSVNGVEVKSGNFTFENQRAKIVWVSVPSEQEFTLKLRISADASASNQGTIVQKFYYLDNNERKEVEGNTVTLGGGSSMASSGGSSTQGGNTTSTQVESVGSGGNTTGGNTGVPVETVKSVNVGSSGGSTASSSGGNTNTTKVGSSSSAGNSAVVEGVTYKVQLGAFSAQPSKGKFAGAGSVNVDMVDGLYKVTTGNFKTKEEAIKHRDALQAKGFSGFIVTFKNGQRVK